VIALLVIFVVIAALVILVPSIATAVARNVVSSMDRAASGSIDQSLVEARLGRIEEAIDAMALQIERLSEHQRTLLGSEPPQLEEPDPRRTESG
jgi:predicted secreted protein